MYFFPATHWPHQIGRVPPPFIAPGTEHFWRSGKATPTGAEGLLVACKASNHKTLGEATGGSGKAEGLADGCWYMGTTIGKPALSAATPENTSSVTVLLRDFLNSRNLFGIGMKHSGFPRLQYM
jgi:hypothetical protein